MLLVKRTILLGACAAAISGGAVVLAAPASADCPWGTRPSHFEGVCVAGAGKGSSTSGNAVVPPPDASPPLVQTLPGGQLSSVAGIPCTPENMGRCIALQQSQGG
ncbi:MULTISPECIES: hypothetical protein [Mycobacteriaceae]|jgi:hypothetical protein|nr:MULTISPECIES: hypothetical protein [Mycobacteriaceae]MCV7251578.1 hypothetical protein [Mycobacterium hackensackense]